MENSDHIILVSGATGQQGGAVAHHLLKQGFRVRALTRNPQKPAAQALAESGAEVMEGNLDDRASLDRALTGAYGAYSVQNYYEAGYDNEIEQGITFANAAQAAGVKHFVYSSVGGAERNTGIPHFESKWRVEEHLGVLNLPATVLRPVFFMDNWLRLKDAIGNGQLPQPLSPDTSLQQIAVDDIGAFAALAFSNPQQWIGRSIEIAGDQMTMTKVAQTFGQVLIREVQYVQIPWEAFEKQAGPEITAMYRWFESDGYKAEIDALRKTYPPLKKLTAFIRDRNWNQSV